MLKRNQIGTFDLLSIAQLKAHCSIDLNWDNNLIEKVYLPAAVDYIFRASGGLALRPDTYAETFSSENVRCFSFPRKIKLFARPVKSISNVKVYDENTPTTVDSSNYYLVGNELVFKNSFAFPIGKRIEVNYVAGYSKDDADVPQEAFAALATLIGHYHENREAVVVGPKPEALPLSFEGIIGLLSQPRAV